jgi:hypothetical protein
MRPLSQSAMKMVRDGFGKFEDKFFSSGKENPAPPRAADAQQAAYFRAELVAERRSLLTESGNDEPSSTARPTPVGANAPR